MMAGRELLCYGVGIVTGLIGCAVILSTIISKWMESVERKMDALNETINNLTETYTNLLKEQQLTNTYIKLHGNHKSKRQHEACTEKHDCKECKYYQAKGNKTGDWCNYCLYGTTKPGLNDSVASTFYDELLFKVRDLRDEEEGGRFIL